MFERYRERARRVIFFAHYEAARVESSSIETEHMLLALLHEGDGVVLAFLRAGDSTLAIRRDIEERLSKKPSPTATATDVPLSLECKRALAYAAEEAERLRHPWIGTVHILLGLLREQQCVAGQILRAHGIDASVVRQRCLENPERFQDEIYGASGPDVKVTHEWRAGPRQNPRPKLMRTEAQNVLGAVVYESLLPEQGCVPDAETAKKVAEAVWIPIYGQETVEAQKPLWAELSELGSVWIVTGSHAEGESAGRLFAHIQKRDGSISKLGRTE